MCVDCTDCQYCFGCVGLSGSEFCILNEALRTSGLLRAHRQARESDAKIQGVSQSPQSVILEALWSKVLEDFSSDKAHQAFLTHCKEADMLPEAAKRYREHKNTLNEDQEDERESVAKRLNAVALLAMSQLDDRRTARPPTRGRQLVVALAALIAIGSAIGLALAAMN